MVTGQRTGYSGRGSLDPGTGGAGIPPGSFATCFDTPSGNPRALPKMKLPLSVWSTSSKQFDMARPYEEFPATTEFSTFPADS